PSFRRTSPWPRLRQCTRTFFPIPPAVEAQRTTPVSWMNWLQTDFLSAGDQTDNIFKIAGGRRADRALMANAIQNLAIPINLAQLAASFLFRFAGNHEVIDNHADARTDAECI